VAPFDYNPVILRKPFRSHLTVDTLSSEKEIISFPASKELPLLLDINLWSQAEWDFNPPDKCTARHTL